MAPPQTRSPEAAGALARNADPWSAARARGASKALFLLAAGISFLISVYLWFLVDREQGLFVGLWVPSILSLGALIFGGKESGDG